jgi:hypothetical protein
MGKENAESIFLANSSSETESLHDNFTDAVLDQFKVSSNDMQKLDLLERISLHSQSARKAKKNNSSKSSRKVKKARSPKKARR